MREADIKNEEMKNEEEIQYSFGGQMKEEKKGTGQ
jgi:hypothetical protein